MLWKAIKELTRLTARLFCDFYFKGQLKAILTVAYVLWKRDRALARARRRRRAV